MITGFFMFDGAFSYFKKIKKLIVDVLFPTLIIIALIILSRTVLASQEVNFFVALKDEIENVLRQILSWGFSQDYGYLWFILVYIEVIIAYPLLYVVCKEDKVATIARRVLICIALLSIFCYDIVTLINVDFSINIFTLIDGNFLFVLLGYEMKLYSKKKRMLNYVGIDYAKSVMLYLLSLVLIIACTMLRYCLYGADGLGWNNRYYFLYNIPVILCAVTMFNMFLNFKVRRANKLISGLSAITFFVYLVQSPIHGLRSAFIQIPIFDDFAYVLIGILVTVLSFIIAKLFQVCYNIAVNMINKVNIKLFDRFTKVREAETAR